MKKFTIAIFRFCLFESFKVTLISSFVVLVYRSAFRKDQRMTFRSWVSFSTIWTMGTELRC